MFKLIKKILSHRLILFLALAVLGGGGYFGYQKFFGNEESGQVSYTTQAASKETIIVSVSGTGQVSASNQVEIKPEASGKITALKITAGQSVKEGGLLAQIDATDALKSVRDAKNNLESAQLSLEKLQQPPDALDIIEAENSLAEAKESKTSAEDDLVKSYDDGFNSVANAFLDLPTVMAGLEDVLYGNDFSNNIWNIDYYKGAIDDYDDIAAEKYKAEMVKSYEDARDKYDANFKNYKTASRYSDEATIESLISETYETTKTIAEAIKDMSNIIDIYQDLLTQHNISIPNSVSGHENDLESYTGTTNTHITSLLSIKNTITKDKETIISAERSIKSKTEKLANLQAGTDPLDIQSQELSIQQKKNALLDAQQQLADYSIRAPFSGVIAEVSAQKGESASSGTAIATLITDQKIAEISLNEIDAAQVKVGQKVTLEFDAIEDLSITGEVAEIDTLGTVSQGVVSYDVKIAFDVQDERIKPGMSLSANVIINSKNDVLVIPATAVKTANQTSYVEVLVDGTPQRKTVLTGLSDDTSVEITSGLAEGDLVITQTSGGSSTTSKTNTNSNNNDAMRGMMQLNGSGQPPR